VLLRGGQAAKPRHHLAGLPLPCSSTTGTTTSANPRSRPSSEPWPPPGSDDLADAGLFRLAPQL